MLPLLFLAACATSPPAPEGPVFVRDGVVLGTEVTGARALPGDRWLVEVPWTPGAEVVVGDSALRAPTMAECVPLFHVDLGDVAMRVAAKGAAPDTALAFSPDGSLLAIGSYGGQLLLVDAWSGEVRARRRLAESMLKQVAWSPDGRVLYAGEQSPDAFLYALDAGSLETRWQARLADRVGSSAPPPADDLYGVYTLPGAYGVHVLPDGDLLVAAVHAWNPEEGARRNLSQMVLFSPDGAERARWPDEAVSVTLMHPRVGDGLVAVPVGRSATGPDPADLPVNGIQVLSLPHLEPVTAATYSPLAPWFTSVFLWEAVDIGGGALLAGLADGRVVRHELASGVSAQTDLGSPILAGDVPISAPIGHALLDDDRVVVVTGATTIPYGAAQTAMHPPAPHPNANALWVLDSALELVWTWRGPHDLEGLTTDPAGQTLVVGAGKRHSDGRRDLFGALVFDLAGEGTGAERLQTFCATEAPVFFRQVVTADGRVAVVEYPYTQAEGALAGRYQVTVLR
ncbi:MAG: hypothetical protein JRI25_05740 [Deltaproteobacteria bacterium]|nr:hypothetical protein [Deltaproteobacteria bacterium]MBW2254086.1 hypothetical protein [Deltaproteobacteria bacterium]